MEIKDIRQQLLARLKREKNGAVVDAVDALVEKTMFSYGVSLPTIKMIASQYKGNHELALNLFQSNIRELKLSAIYICDPELVNLEQVKEWTESLTSLELIENVTFALFSKCDIAEDIIEFWSQQNIPLLGKGVELLKLHRRRFLGVSL
ncbi:MAG: DNA alkylation repair protein [Rikenellaceae bacterium]